MSKTDCKVRSRALENMSKGISVGMSSLTKTFLLRRLLGLSPAELKDELDRYAKTTNLNPTAISNFIELQKKHFKLVKERTELAQSLVDCIATKGPESTEPRGEQTALEKLSKSPKHKKRKNK